MVFLPWCCIVLGALMALGALAAGPTAFDMGWLTVLGGVACGALLSGVGVYELVLIKGSEQASRPNHTHRRRRGFRLRSLLLLVAVVAVVLGISKWLFGWRTLVIAGDDIASTHSFKIPIRPIFAHSAIALEASGSIDGSATLKVFDGDQPTCSVQLETGEVDLATQCDHYTDNARLQYVPENASRGQLVIKYKFYLD
jgi:hypothetical protein